jgi:MFS family permease
MTLAETLRRGGLARSSLDRVTPTGAAPVGPTPPAATPPTDAPLRDWIGVLAMGTGLFMAIMDVQIVTSSLTQIQGGLSASTDEIAWVQTAYLIADVVMVPMSGIMSRLLSTRVLFVVAALGFTATSVLCATATSLGQMIGYRVSGDAGFLWRRDHANRVAGRHTRFRGRQLATVIAMISVILSLSSTLGPTLGGFFDGYAFLALAVLGQHRPGSHSRRGRMGNHRHQQARFFAAAPFRLDGHAADGSLSWLPAVCS